MALWYTSSASAGTLSGASRNKSTTSLAVRCLFTSTTYASRSLSAFSGSAHRMCRSARTPALRSRLASRGMAMSSMTYAGAISRKVRSIVSCSSVEKPRPASATRIWLAMSSSSHPSPTRGGVATSAL